MITWLLKLLRDYALKEKYNMKKINNQIKENNLLFEIGEIPKIGYKEKNKLLMEKLEKAKQIQENLSKFHIREIGETR